MREALPEEQLAEMSNNPQALVNPEALAGLKASLADRGEQGGEVLSSLLATLRETLASAISDVFVLATVTLILGFVATLFLKGGAVEDAGAGAWKFRIVATLRSAYLARPPLCISPPSNGVRLLVPSRGSCAKWQAG